MSEPLYDVCAQPKSREMDASAQFMMRAPMRVIIQVLDLSPDARLRIEMETKIEGGLCLLYHSRGRWVNTVHGVMRARVPLEVDR